MKPLKLCGRVLESQNNLHFVLNGMSSILMLNKKIFKTEKSNMENRLCMRNAQWNKVSAFQPIVGYNDISLLSSLECFKPSKCGGILLVGGLGYLRWTISEEEV